MKKKTILWERPANWRQAMAAARCGWGVYSLVGHVRSGTGRNRKVGGFSYETFYISRADERTPSDAIDPYVWGLYFGPTFLDAYPSIDNAKKAALVWLNNCGDPNDRYRCKIHDDCFASSNLAQACLNDALMKFGGYRFNWRFIDGY